MMRSAISPRLAIRIFLNMVSVRGRIANRRSPYCTGWPFSRRRLTISPSYSESISFISFIASMMQSTWPFFTVSPTSTNAAAPGSAER